MMGWLAATPRPYPGARPENAPKMSRAEQFERSGTAPAMPPLSTPWFIERLTEIGIVEPSGMGQGPISWTTLRAWQQLTGTPLAPWEARLLRALSAAFLAARNEGEDPLAQPPFFDQMTVIDPERAELQLRAALLSAAV